MRTKEQHIQSLAKMKRNIYFNGNLIDRTDRITGGMPRNHRDHVR